MENKLCRKCHERPVANDILPYCPYCWNNLDSTIPAERNALVYYGNKMFLAQNPELEKQYKEKKKATQKAYFEKNKDKWNAYQREYYKRKKDKMKALEEEVARLKAQQTAVNS